jgi:HEAT repeat protein
MRRAFNTLVLGLLAGAVAVGSALAQEADVQGLITKLEGKDSALRIEAAKALMQLGPKAKDAVPALVKLLDDDNPLVRQKAVIALGLIHSQPELAVPALRKAIKDKGVFPKEQRTSVARAAVDALSYFGPQAKEAIPDLVELARSDNYSLKMGAVGTLGSIRSEPEKVVPLLIEMLKAKNERFLKAAAATALACYGPDPKTAALLRKAFECDDVENPDQKKILQSSIAQDMGKMGLHAKPYLPWLIGLFQDLKEEDGLRRAAFRAVGDLGPDGRDAIPALIACLNDKDYSGHHAEVIRALVSIGEEAAVRLGLNLEHPDPYVRQLTAEALGKMGAKGAPAIPALERAIRGSETPVTRGAIRALEQIKEALKMK